MRDKSGGPVQGRFTVLAVEDEDFVREYIVRILDDGGYDVIGAADGIEAREQCENRSRRIDAIVSDLRMPRCNGEELAEYNFENRFLPFIVCTAVADAETALKLMKFGVKDYLVKPITKRRLLSSVRNAIYRRIQQSPSENGDETYAGNVDSIVVPSTARELARASMWIEKRLETAMSPGERQKFVNFASEFLINAHEHGNLKITEDEKTALMENDLYSGELKAREEGTKAVIAIALSVLDNEVALKISDEGAGFDSDFYLNMNEEMLFERLEKPNGRGIYMSSRYFDSVKYGDGGASVILTRKIEKKNHNG